MSSLHHLPLSPFCRKVRLVLGEKRIETALIEETPWERRRDFLILAPNGRVPLYVTDDGHAIGDSVAIVEYLDEAHPEPPLLPGDALSRAEARRLAQWFDDKFHREVTRNLLYERVYTKIGGAGAPDGAAIRAGAANVKHHLDYIAWLVERRRWLAGDLLTIADFAAAAHLSSLDYMGDVPWDHAEPARDWYARVKSRPAFRDLLADRVPGLPPVAHYADLDF